MRKFDQIDGSVTLAIMLGRDSLKITKADSQWYEIKATTVSGRRLVACFTVLKDIEVPEDVLNVASVDNFGDDGEMSNIHVREWLRDAAGAGNIYVQHFIHAYGMDESEVFASFLGRECTEE